MRMIAWLLFLILVAGCDKGQPVAPSSLATEASGHVPILNGTVFETTPDGRRPVPGAYINVLSYGPKGGYGITAYADAEGRYTVNTLASGSAVLVHAMGGLDGVGFHRHQPCVATAVLQEDTRLDVEFNLTQVRGSGGSPIVSGTVFDTTATGRQPVGNRQVLYYSQVLPYSATILAAHTITDANGRFEFCKVPLGAGKVFVTDPVDWDLGRPAAERTINVVGDIAVELEISK